MQHLRYPLRHIVKPRTKAMTAIGHDSLNTRRTLSVGGKDYAYYLSLIHI